MNVEPNESIGLLDTSTVILLPRLTRVGDLPQEPGISTITLAELSVGPLVAKSETGDLRG